jgi:WhiB family redox-sensing transcriptional regulator
MRCATAEDCRRRCALPPPLSARRPPSPPCACQGAVLPHPPAPRLPIAWREAAACRQADPELFFPIGSAGVGASQIDQAKAVCASCLVREPCLAYALANGQEFGIWGGRDENERRALQRQRRETRIAADEERRQG